MAAVAAMFISSEGGRKTSKATSKGDFCLLLFFMYNFKKIFFKIY